MLSSLDTLSSKLSKEQFGDMRKYLQSFYFQQPNQPQANNVIEAGEEGEAVHAHKDYQNHPYQTPTLMSDHQQQTEEDLALMTQKEVYPY